jgi:hypothetical protein
MTHGGMFRKAAGAACRTWLCRPGRRGRQCAMSHRCMLRGAGGAAHRRNLRLRRRRREYAVARGSMLGRAGRGAGRRCRRLRCGSRQGAVPHRRMFSSTGATTGRCCGLLRWGSRQRAMTGRGVLGRAASAGSCSGRWSRLGRRSGWSTMARLRMLRRAGRGACWSGWRGLAAGLRECRRSCASEQQGEDGLHAASPSSGRTFTTRIMPACM